MIKLTKFYITTPIFYTNASAHIGHAYTTIAADILARWHRLKGEDVFFLTGTDEHGEKIAKAAEAAGKTPQEFVDQVAGKFVQAWKRLNISNDDFIRTTEKRHEESVNAAIEKIFDNGDIYKGEYEGLYCIGCESFKTDSELVNGKCPDHSNLELKHLKEESYFFKLSKYQDRLLKYYEEHPNFISPNFRADEIKNRVKEGLRDLSITRRKLKWGVPFSIDKNHVIYVWVEALMNYFSALGFPNGKNFKKYWPQDVHIEGKEINWFHTVVWPAILFSLGVEQPRIVFSHGWWTVEGRKMSKSLGNVIDPVKLADRYSVDAVRYFLIRETPFGEDGEFYEKKLIERVNGELVADLGNLVYRVLTLAEKFDGKIEGEAVLDKKLDVEKIDRLIDDVRLTDALIEVWSFIRAANKYVNETEPWKLKGNELGSVIYNLLEATRVISILISPFLPETADEICRQLGVEPGRLKDAKFGKFAGKISKGRYLFQKID